MSKHGHAIMALMTIVMILVIGVIYVEIQKTSLVRHFEQLTQTRGAWSMDREYVAQSCGFDVNKLPSVKQ